MHQTWTACRPQERLRAKMNLGMCLRQAAEEQAACMQVPSLWRPVLEDAATLQLFLDIYSCSQPPLSRQALECLVSSAFIKSSCSAEHAFGPCSVPLPHADYVTLCFGLRTSADSYICLCKQICVGSMTHCLMPLEHCHGSAMSSPQQCQFTNPCIKAWCQFCMRINDASCKEMLQHCGM